MGVDTKKRDKKWYGVEDAANADNYFGGSGLRTILDSAQSQRMPGWCWGSPGLHLVILKGS